MKVYPDLGRIINSTTR